MYVVPLLIISQALAQPEAVETVTEPATTVAYRSVTVLDEDAFGHLQLDGVLVRPSGLLTVVTPRPAFHPLFQLRRNFETEISESPGEIGRLSAP